MESSSSPSLDVAFRALAERIVDRLDEICAEGVARVRAEAPEWTVERPELGELLRSGTRASVEAELLALRDGATIPGRLPAIDAEGARFCARTGVPLGLNLFLYRIGHAVQWQAWFELVEAEEPDPGRRRELLERGSSFFFDYADRLTRLAAEEHQRERERLLRGHEQRRVHLVRTLLDGGEVDASALDYPLDARHLALVAWGPQASAAAQRLAELLDRRLLLVELLQDTWWGWLGGRRPLAARLGGAVRALALTDGTRVALGDDEHGVDGFRRSHRQATQAHAIAVRLDVPLTSFEDVALEVLAGQDPDAARRFVKRELRDLGADDARAARLRETLDAYFSRGQNAAATAAALGLHEQTIAKRIAAAERLTGRPVLGRRAELETALRLRRCLP